MSSNERFRYHISTFTENGLFIKVGDGICHEYDTPGATQDYELLYEVL